MSCFTIKKLSNYKKALKRLISKLQPELPHFSKSRATPTATYQKLSAQKGVSLAYMDQLYIESYSMHDKDSSCTTIAPAVGAMQRGQVEDQEYDEDDKVVVCSSLDSRLSSLQLHGVDAKAEEFIRKRREAWKIERQKSLDEYFEMLSRGT